jgi:hypothetical protein
MNVLNVVTADEIDRELATRTAEVAAFAAALLELDNHPGLEHVRRYPPTGVTAQRWVPVEESIGQLWEGMGWMTSILQSARAVRERRSKLDDLDRAELTGLLRDRAPDVWRQRNPLAQHMIAGSDDATDHAGLPDTADRMRDAYPAVAEFLDAVDKINCLTAAGLAPALKRLDEAGGTIPTEVTDLLRVSASDPLSLTAHDVEERVLVIGELVAFQANWPEAVAATASRLDALRDATQHVAQTRARAGEDVAPGLPAMRTDAEPGLRARLLSINTPDAAALRSLQNLIESALKLVRDEEELAQGLLDRRCELRGRLTAYQAKAARLGLGKDPDLSSSGRAASGLLSRRPCDLRAATTAITEYQQVLADKQRRTK